MTDTLELPPVVTDQPDELEAALMELGSLLVYTSVLEQRNIALHAEKSGIEQRNAALRAENAQLRKRLCLAAAEGVQS